MATYLPRDVYNSFRGTEDLAAIANQFHASLDASLPTFDAPTSSDSLTNPTLTPPAAPAPDPDVAPPPVAAAPAPAPLPPVPIAPLVAPPSMQQPAPTPASTSWLDDLGTKFHQGLDAVVRGTPAPPVVLGVSTASDMPTPSDTLTRPIGGAARGDTHQSQFGMGLSSDQAYAACGPAAAIGFARQMGRNPTAEEAMQLASSVGWTAGAGMAGVSSEQALLQKMGIATKLEQGSALDWTHIGRDASNGNPVILDTPGHYLYVDDAKAGDDGTMLYHIGTSGTDLKGGQAWETKAQIEAHTATGAVRGALYADSPASPHPSIAGSSTPGSGLSAYDGTFQKYAGDLASDPEFIKIVTAGAKGESGLNPTAVQSGGGGRGLFQMDIQGGMGVGKTTEQLNSADYQASVMVPLYAAAYKQAPPNLSPADKAAWVAVQVEKPDDRQGQASANYRNAYNSLGGGTVSTTQAAAPSSNPVADVVNTINTAKDQVGQAKDSLGSNLSDIASNFHQQLDDTVRNVTGPQPMAASQQPTPSDTLTNPTVGPVTPQLQPAAAPQPTVFDQFGALAESAAALNRGGPNEPVPATSDVGSLFGQQVVPDILTPLESAPGRFQGATGQGDVLGAVGVILGTAADVTSLNPGGGEVKATAELADVVAKSSPEIVQTALSKAQEAVDALRTRFPEMSPGSLAASKEGKVLAAVQAAAKDLPEATAAVPSAAADVAPSVAGAAPAAAPSPRPSFEQLPGETNAEWIQRVDNPAPVAPVARTAPLPADATTVPPPAGMVPEYQRIAQEAVDASRARAAARAEAPAQAVEAHPASTFDAQGNQVSGADPALKTASTPAPAPDWLETAVAEQRAAGPKIAGETDLGPAIGQFSDLQTASAKAPPSLGNIAWGVMAEGKKSIFSLSNVHAMNIARGLTTSPAGPGGAAQFAKAYVNAIVRGVQEHPVVTAAVEAATKDGVQFFAHSPETGGAVGGVNPLIVKGAQAALGGVSSASSVYGASKAGGASDQDALRNAVIAGGIGAIAGPTLAIRMHDALWKDAVPLAKVLSWSAAKEAGLSGPEAAKFANNLNGGQGLSQIAGSKPLWDLARLVVQSPDWLLSQLKLTRDAGVGIGKTVMDPGSLKSLVGGQMTSPAMTGSQQVSRDWLIKQLMVYGFVTEAVQFGFTGHFTDQNSPGHQFMVEMPTGSSSKSGKSENMTASLFDGNLQQVLDAVAKHDLGSTLAGKVNPWLATPIELLTNKQYLAGNAPPITGPNETGLDEKWKQAQFVASKFAPIGISSPVQEAYAGAPLPAIVASTLTGLPMSHNTGAPGSPSSRSAPAPAATRARTVPAPRVPARASRR